MFTSNRRAAEHSNAATDSEYSSMPTTVVAVAVAAIAIMAPVLAPVAMPAIGIDHRLWPVVADFGVVDRRRQRFVDRYRGDVDRRTRDIDRRSAIVRCVADHRTDDRRVDADRPGD